MSPAACVGVLVRGSEGEGWARAIIALARYMGATAMFSWICAHTVTAYDPNGHKKIPPSSYPPYKLHLPAWCGA